MIANNGIACNLFALQMLIYLNINNLNFDLQNYAEDTKMEMVEVISVDLKIVKGT